MPSSSSLLPARRPSPSQPLAAFHFDAGVWLYCSALAVAVPVLLPALQFGFIYRIWAEYDRPVDRDHCFCNCWDTAFKGDP